MAGQVGVQRLGQVGTGGGHAGSEVVIVGGAQVQHVDRVVQNPLQIVAGLAVRIQAAKGLQGDLHVIVQALDLGVDLPQVHQQVQLGMQDAGVGLQVNAVGPAGLGLAGQQHVPMVHVSALGDHTVHKDEELGVLGVVPLLDLGLQVQPQALAGKGLRHGDLGAEPVVLVRAVPVGNLAVDGAVGLVLIAAQQELGQVVGLLMAEGGIGRLSRVRLGGCQIVAGFDLPGGDGHLLFDAQALELVADHADALVHKKHSIPFLPRRAPRAFPF